MPRQINTINVNIGGKPVIFRRERYAEWVWVYNRPVKGISNARESGWECSTCGAGSSMSFKFGEEEQSEEFLKDASDQRSSYCYNCGAKMKEWE